MDYNERKGYAETKITHNPKLNENKTTVSTTKTYRSTHKFSLERAGVVTGRSHILGRTIDILNLKLVEETVKTFRERASSR